MPIDLILINNNLKTGGNLHGHRLAYALLEILSKERKLGKVYIFSSGDIKILPSDILRLVNGDPTVRVLRYYRTVDNFVETSTMLEIDMDNFIKWLEKKQNDKATIIVLDAVFLPPKIAEYIFIKQGHAGHRTLVNALSTLLGRKIISFLNNLNNNNNGDLNSLLNEREFYLQCIKDLTYSPQKSIEFLKDKLNLDVDVQYDLRSRWCDIPCVNGVPCKLSFKRATLDEILVYENSKYACFISKFRRDLEILYNSLFGYQRNPEKEKIVENGVINNTHFYRNNLGREYLLAYYYEKWKKFLSQFDAILLFVGRQHLEKGILDLYLMMHYIKESYPDLKVVLLIKGKDLSINDLRNSPLWLPREFRYWFRKKYLDDKRQIFLVDTKTTDIETLVVYDVLKRVEETTGTSVYLVHPSYADDYGLPVAEAIVAGIVPIVYDWQGPGEIVRKYGGLAVDPGNYERMAKYIANNKKAKIYPDKVRSIYDQANDLIRYILR